tara:strand:- start:322 stop:1560 length:1239 start_codon:yes stop_codon:yes gene_type:complete
MKDTVLLAWIGFLGFVLGCRDPLALDPLPPAPKSIAAIESHPRFFWKFDLGDASSSSPTIGHDGTVYIGSRAKDPYEGILYAINPKSGRKKWEFRTGGSGVFSNPVVGADGTVFISDARKVFALNGKTGVKKWEAETIGQTMSKELALDANGTLIAIGGTICALNSKNGEKKWETDSIGYMGYPPSFGVDGTFYITYGHRIFAHSIVDGSVKWKTDRENYTGTPALTPDGTLYVVGEQGGSSSTSKVEIHALDGKTGQKKWAFVTHGASEFGASDSSGFCASPVIGSDGIVYVSASDSIMYALDGQTGQKKWTFAAKQWVSKTAAVGSDGTVYYGTEDYSVYALNGKTGAKLWEFPTGSIIQTSPALSLNGTLFIASCDKHLYAIKTDSRGLAKSPWPMSGQNNLRTSRALK